MGHNHGGDIPLLEQDLYYKLSEKIRLNMVDWEWRDGIVDEMKGQQDVGLAGWWSAMGEGERLHRCEVRVGGWR